jgi:hypothetical protein
MRKLIIIGISFVIMGATRFASPLDCPGQTACDYDWAGPNSYACTYSSLEGVCCQQVIYSVHCTGGGYDTQVDAYIVNPATNCRSNGLCLIGM